MLQQQKLKMNQQQRNPRKKLLEVQRAVTLRMGSSFRRTWGEQMERVSTLASLFCSTLSSTTSIPTLRATAWGTTSLRVFRWISLSFYIIHLSSAQVLVHSPNEFAEVIIDNIMVYVEMLSQVSGKGIAVGIGTEVNIGLSAQVIKSQEWMDWGKTK